MTVLEPDVQFWTKLLLGSALGRFVDKDNCIHCYLSACGVITSLRFVICRGSRCKIWEFDN